MTEKNFRQDIAVTVDAIVFTPKTGHPQKVLLIQRKNPPHQGMWAFPGGFVDPHEDLDVAARRELEEETGLKVQKITQFLTAGEPGRDPRGHTISVCYTARASDRTKAIAADDAADAQWFSLDDLPALAFDHEKILTKAVHTETHLHHYAYPHPAVTTDIVVFSIRDGRLNALLIDRKIAPFKGKQALPGGFVRPNESLDACAARELQEETGVENVFLEQLYSFGTPERDPRERVVTVAYYALIPSDKIDLKAGTDAENAAWTPVEEIKSLSFDHLEILEAARERLKAKLEYSNIVLQFLPKEFTLSEVQSIYEIVLGATVDKRNFRKWLDAHCSLQETGETRRAGAHRPAKLYKVKGRKDLQVLK